MKRKKKKRKVLLFLILLIVVIIFSFIIILINKEIDNLNTALASGIRSISIKDKLNNLEEKKIHLSTLKSELQCSLDSKVLDENLIRQYLLKDASLIKNKSVDLTLYLTCSLSFRYICLKIFVLFLNRSIFCM